MQLYRLESYLDPEKNSYGVAPYTCVELFIQIRISGMVLLPKKRLLAYKHFHKGRTIGSNIVNQKFVVFYLRDEQPKHLIKDSPTSTFDIKNEYL